MNKQINNIKTITTDTQQKTNKQASSRALSYLLNLTIYSFVVGYFSTSFFLFFLQCIFIIYFLFLTMWSLTSVELSLSITTHKYRRWKKKIRNKIYTHALDNCSSTFNQKSHKQTTHTHWMKIEKKIQITNISKLYKSIICKFVFAHRVYFFIFYFVMWTCEYFGFMFSFFYVNATMQFQYFNLQQKNSIAHTQILTNQLKITFILFNISSFEWIPKFKTFHACFFFTCPKIS